MTTELQVLPPLSRTAAQHPLASQQGVTVLSNMLTADMAWSKCTPRQQELLRALKPTLRQAVATAGVGGTVELPSLPEGLSRRTVDSLTRQGLVADGRLTTLGGLVVWYARRPVVTKSPVGEVL